MRRAFTLIELLVVIGTISILSTMTIVAVAPRKNLGEATDAKRKHNIKELQSAQYQYLIDHGVFAVDQALPTTEASQMPVCRFSKTDSSCINIDPLIGDYIACLPVDSMEANVLHTGYTAFTNAGRIQVRSTYLGLGVATHTCENSSTSLESSVASSSAGSEIADPPYSSSFSSANTTSSSAITSASSSSSTTTSSSVMTSASASSSSTATCSVNSDCGITDPSICDTDPNATYIEYTCNDSNNEEESFCDEETIPCDPSLDE
ncbi:MAG: type II secretion system protein [Patescibacteria group bacterium]